MSAKRIIAAGSILFWVLSISVCGVSLLAAQVPRSEKEIPIYPRAVRDMNKESSLRSEMGRENSSNLRSAVLKVYKTGASPEEVFTFYLQKIGAKKGAGDIDPRGLERGTISPVSYEIDYYKDEDFADYEGQSRAWMKQSLMKNRKPYTSEKWITGGYINWYKKEGNNDLTTFYINVHDESFEQPPEKYETATSIQIDVASEKSEEAAREEADAQMDKTTKELSVSVRSKPPTAKDLGAPLYPGAKFDATSSAGMSAGNDYAIYIYFTADSPSRVAAFYEQQLKIKPVEVGNGQYMIPLKGKMPIPDEGISIQPNTMFGGSAKTVISVQKMTGKNE